MAFTWRRRGLIGPSFSREKKGPGLRLIIGPQAAPSVARGKDGEVVQTWRGTGSSGLVVKDPVETGDREADWEGIPRWPGLVERIREKEP